jgi:hypothetical protein
VQPGGDPVRVELPDGQWAQLRERLSYGPAREVRRTFVVASEDRAAMVDVDIALVRAYLVDWNVLDTEGHAVPVDKPELAPDDVIQTLSETTMDLWNGKPDPKDITEPLPITSRARRSG